MNSKLAVLIVLTLSVGLIGNAYAHKSQVIDDYKIEAGWKYEPPTDDGKRNYIELIVTKASAEDKASAMSNNMDHDEEDMDEEMAHEDNATKSDHEEHDEDEHDSHDGISGLAKKLEVDITLNGKKTHLKLHESLKHSGYYLAVFTPSEEGFPSVHIFGKILESEVEATFHPEKIEAMSK